jgi:hypothetical protein
MSAIIRIKKYPTDRILNPDVREPIVCSVLPALNTFNENIFQPAVPSPVEDHPGFWAQSIPGNRPRSFSIYLNVTHHF